MAAPIPSDPQPAPEGFAKAFAQAWATRDGARIAALFTEDADFVNVTGLWWHGSAAIAKPHDYALKSFFAETELSPGRTECRRIGEDVAVLRCRFRLSGQRAPDGSTAGPRQTILTFVLQRFASGWLAVSAQNTDVVPGMETHVSGPEGFSAVDYRT
ncbi:YybH family protein [Primorskyibacter sp. 2E233]|uniref:YybH family protein n=1 Tax=Primorskyibacter sp. 2E233 TaxID=3413431 RepID=UPI003BF39D05